MLCAGRKQTADEPYRQGTSNLIFVIFLLFFFIFSFIPSTSALTSLNIFIDESGSAVFLGETDDNISVLLPDGVSVVDGEITGISDETTGKTGEEWQFSFSLPNSEITVILPVGAVITDLNDGEISIDGNRIAIFVNDELIVTYVIRDSSSLSNGSSINVPLLLIFLAAILVLIVFLINFTKREKRNIKEELQKQYKLKQKKKQQSTLDIIKQVLNERERLIVDRLKETGKVKGSQLRKLTDMPKASFSRHIQELEKKGLIKRTGEGRNKYIELLKK